MSPSPQEHREKTFPFQAMVRVGIEPDPAPRGPSSVLTGAQRLTDAQYKEGSFCFSWPAVTIL